MEGDIAMYWKFHTFQFGMYGSSPHQGQSPPQEHRPPQCTEFEAEQSKFDDNYFQEFDDNYFQEFDGNYFQKFDDNYFQEQQRTCHRTTIGSPSSHSTDTEYKLRKIQQTHYNAM